MITQEINTPRGSVVQGPYGYAVLSWNSNFKPKWTKRYSAAQRYLDSEILRLCEPYTPMKTGMMIKSGTLGTVLGSGWIIWIAPYSRHQYYLVRKTKSETGPLRGSYWFQRMKEVHIERVIERTRRIAGGRSGY